MASGIEDDFSKLKLTEAEEDILDFDDLECADFDTQLSLCLVGKLVAENSFNGEATKRAVITNFKD